MIQKIIKVAFFYHTNKSCKLINVMNRKHQKHSNVKRKIVSMENCMQVVSKGQSLDIALNMNSSSYNPLIHVSVIILMRNCMRKNVK